MKTCLTLLNSLCKKDRIVDFGDFSVTESTSDAITPIAGESAMTLFGNVDNNGYGTQVFDADLRFNGFFTVNPNGHFVIAMRRDLIHSTPPANTGHAIIFGNLMFDGFGVMKATNTPVALPESLNKVTEVIRREPAFSISLWPEAQSPQLQDNVDYKIQIKSTYQPSGASMKYTLWKKNGTKWSVFYISPVIDEPAYDKDLNKTSIVLASVFGDTSGAQWSVAFKNAKLTFQ